MYVVTSKWIYKIKHAADGSVEKYKMRSIAKGFSQKEGVVYDETLDPVKPDTLPSVLPSMSWKLYHIDKFLMSFDFSKSVADPNIHHYSVDDKSQILMNYSESLVVGYN
jgi:hypothetical protein